jgi:hypothetical protein
MPRDYRLFVNDERTVLVRIWVDGRVEVCTREDSDGIWGPPVLVEEER